MAVTSIPSCKQWWSPFRANDAVSIAHVDLSVKSSIESEALEWLDSRELDRWRRYEYEGPRRRFALCRAALRAILCEELACSNEQLAFANSLHGKPVAMLANQDAAIHFNVSHSTNHGLVAVSSDRRVGVDVEERASRRNLDLLVDTVLSKNELANYAQSNECERYALFFKLWTIKEAVLKAYGVGLKTDVSSIEVPAAIRSGGMYGTMRLPELPAVTWHVEYLGTKQFAAAIAYEQL
jgi:4'-phosphopantetheinyl transferase